MSAGSGVRPRVRDSGLVLAHRLSRVLDCDEIAVLGEDRVTARGTHAELLAGHPLYRCPVSGPLVAEVVP